ncbi:MAG: hypothetical protein KKB62_02870 [Nanoarchaeota archaeon]|nr:hypothetical protein [Nanoarchaeota archaeon]
MEFSKKGELTTQQIVILIILIVSFAVIVFFLIRINLGKQTEQEICHNSVVTRGKSILPADTFPLQCKRRYVCMSSDGSCEAMTNPDIIRVNTKDELYGALSEQLAECWWMFGEGKVNYVGSDTLPTLYCSICSQIAFDDSVGNRVFEGTQEFDKREFYNYMATHTYSGDQTYLYYLLGTNDVNRIYSGDFGNVTLQNQYYSLVGAWSKTSAWTWAGLGAIGFVAIAATGGAGLVVGALAFTVGGVSTYFLAPVILGSSGNRFIPSTLVEVNSRQFNDLGCETITTSS